VRKIEQSENRETSRNQGMFRLVTPAQAAFARLQRKPLQHHICDPKCCTAEVRKMGIKY
jgi:hypothetical protein